MNEFGMIFLSFFCMGFCVSILMLTPWKEKKHGFKQKYFGASKDIDQYLDDTRRNFMETDLKDDMEHHASKKYHR